MSSYKQRRGGKTKNSETYRPWNAAVLGKSSSVSTYGSNQYAKPERFTDESEDIGEKSESNYSTAQFRPWNAAVLNKLNIENEFSVSILFIT